MKPYKLKTYFVLFILLSCKALTAQSLTENIRLNQLGFYLHANKIAVVVSNISANDFYIITADKKDTAYKGQLSEPKQSTNSSFTTRIADFSALQNEGSYVMYVPHLGYSYQFKIAKNMQASGQDQQAILILKCSFILLHQQHTGMQEQKFPVQVAGMMPVITINIS
ncbi:MAG TPA: cellulase N-terminal Ig-like domain-containing protein [Chitinophagaceae bacterium]|nr:cellulase N-terminal Ig-like domain-containing protein [Chitinophagaceae bacterium]